MIASGAVDYDRQMIARHWRGWTKLKDANEYEELLRTKVFRSLKQIEGYQGGYVLRRDEEESEFIVVNFFDTLDAVRNFAGPNYETAVFEPEAKRLLARFDTVAKHYEVRINTVE
jgi:heme-degrading monooxygenase HmoA